MALGLDTGVPDAVAAGQQRATGAVLDRPTQTPPEAQADDAMVLPGRSNAMMAAKPAPASGQALAVEGRLPSLSGGSNGSILRR